MDTPETLVLTVYYNRSYTPYPLAINKYYHRPYYILSGASGGKHSHAAVCWLLVRPNLTVSITIHENGCMCYKRIEYHVTDIY